MAMYLAVGSTPVKRTCSLPMVERSTRQEHAEPRYVNRLLNRARECITRQFLMVKFFGLVSF
jgi:hypothetical protein